MKDFRVNNNLNLDKNEQIEHIESIIKLDIVTNNRNFINLMIMHLLFIFFIIIRYIIPFEIIIYYVTIIQLILFIATFISLLSFILLNNYKRKIKPQLFLIIFGVLIIFSHDFLIFFNLFITRIYSPNGIFSIFIIIVRILFSNYFLLYHFVNVLYILIIN